MQWRGGVATAVWIAGRARHRRARPERHGFSKEERKRQEQSPEDEVAAQPQAQVRDLHRDLVSLAASAISGTGLYEFVSTDTAFTYVGADRQAHLGMVNVLAVPRVGRGASGWEVRSTITASTIRLAQQRAYRFERRRPGELSSYFLVDGARLQEEPGRAIRDAQLMQPACSHLDTVRLVREPGRRYEGCYLCGEVMQEYALPPPLRERRRASAASAAPSSPWDLLLQSSPLDPR